jgi:gamma-D-glutamyl-L-lysine dipeptidyl-peptidase
MIYGICHLSIIPLRKEASDASEMTNQVLFGEVFEILDKTKNWIKVKLMHDGYEGWISDKQYKPIEAELYQDLLSKSPVYCLDIAQILIHGSTINTILLGSTLPSYDAGKCFIIDQEFLYNGNYASVEEHSGSKNKIIEIAYMYLNAPYLWGGRSPFGIDCSGFTQMVYRMAGHQLRRDAWQQAEQGSTFNLLDEAEPGDLIFFDNEEGKIIHVGILLKDHKIIHASGKVRIDAIDHHGIYNSETKRYSHQLRLVKRIF